MSASDINSGSANEMPVIQLRNYQQIFSWIICIALKGHADADEFKLWNVVDAGRLKPLPTGNDSCVVLCCPAVFGD